MQNLFKSIEEQIDPQVFTTIYTEGAPKKIYGYCPNHNGMLPIVTKNSHGYEFQKTDTSIDRFGLAEILCGECTMREIFENDILLMRPNEH